MLHCERCNKDVDPSQSYVHSARTLCEECYMDVLSPPKACDPWAVYSAKRSATRGETSVTASQRKILDLLSKEGPLTPKVLEARLGMAEADLQRDFATLRHMERLKAMKKDGTIFYALFSAGRAQGSD